MDAAAAAAPSVSKSVLWLRVVVGVKEGVVVEAVDTGKSGILDAIGDDSPPDEIPVGVVALLAANAGEFCFFLW